MTGCPAPTILQTGLGTLCYKEIHRVAVIASTFLGQLFFFDHTVARSRDKHMTAEQHTPYQNRLIACLPADIVERISPHMELISMPLGQVLYESGGQLQHVYFPTTAIVSVHYVMENGASAEIAGVGNEGVLGISFFMGGNTTPSRGTVQTAGFGYRLKGRLIMEEFNRAGPFQNLMLRYTQALITQISQTAVCNRHHSIEQQLCRWLLLTLDRLPSNELTMTQELIASMLGVRREGITEVAGKLQQAGLISYRRGHIKVLDRFGLESRSCECYNVVKEEFHRLLSSGDVT
jgi:CRP-like cAMP-binding protein